MLHVLALFIFLFAPAAEPPVVGVAFDRPVLYRGESATLTITATATTSTTLSILAGVPGYLTIESVEAPVNCSIITPSAIVPHAAQNVRCVIPVAPDAPAIVHITVHVPEDTTPGMWVVPVRVSSEGGGVVTTEATITALARQMLVLIRR